MNKKTRRDISSTNLIRVLKEVDRLSCTKKTKSGRSYDYDLAIPFLRGEGLDKNIIHRRTDKGIGTGLPLNSERSTYAWLSNIIVRNLSVDIDSNAIGKEFTEWESAPVMLHFEDCGFENSRSSFPTFVFPWSGAFRFYRNEFKNAGKPETGCWLFVFGHDSRVMFDKNEFHSVNVQINSSPVQDHALQDGLDRLSFIGNKGISELQPNCHAKYYEFSGGNRIGQLDLGLGSRLPDNSGGREFSFYFGPREKIDPDFHYNRHHRELFLFLRERANKKQDSQIVRTLDRCLERIEYSLIKDQEIRLKEAGRSIWLEYWQDRTLYAMRRLTSDFHRSWLRPLVMIVFGYLGLNAVPWFVIDGFTCSDWISFSLRSIHKVPFYVDGLSEMYGSQYTCLSKNSKNVLRLVGFIQPIWLALLGLVLRKTIAK